MAVAANYEPVKMSKSNESTEKNKTYCVVSVILTRGNGDRRELLFQQRINTSYMANMYDFSASGKVDSKESAEHAAVREAFEEIRVVIKPSNLHCFHIHHATKENCIKLFFWVDTWMVDGVKNGEPQIGEPNKCGDLRWTTYDSLPENLIPLLREVLRYGMAQELYSDDQQNTAL